MLFTDLAPMRKFIVTDILGQPTFNKYTTGYICKVVPMNGSRRRYTVVHGVITRIGKSGKPRIQAKEFYVAPLVYTNLIQHSYYDGITHLITKPYCVNVLTISNFDFLVWVYTRLIYAEKLRISRIWPDAIDVLLKKVYRMARNYSDWHEKEIDEVVGSVAIRELVLQRIQLIYSFLRGYEEDHHTCLLRNMLSRHYGDANLLDHKELYKDIKKHHSLINKGKQLPKEILTENANVSKEYENSGYWV